jgi:Bacterial SH3 domain
MEIQEIITQKREIERELLGRSGIIGVDVGYKYKAGKRTQQVVIRVYVSEKQANISKADRIPKTIRGIKTDVIEAQPSFQVDDNPYTPITGGISFGQSEKFKFVQPDGTLAMLSEQGTLGAIVRDNLTEKPMFLTNHHVTKVMISHTEDRSGKVGDIFDQPNLLAENGKPFPNAPIGKLARFAINPLVDGAVIEYASTRPFTEEIKDIGKVAGVAKATLGMKVRKRGRTTELTYGIIDGLDATTAIQGSSMIFQHQMVIVPDTTKNALFSNAGDSGSVIVNEQNKVVGLLFAGIPAIGNNPQMTWANHIDNVLTQLNVHFKTNDAPTTPTNIFPMVATTNSPIDLNVRSGPGTTFAALSKIKTGTKVTLTEQTNIWFKLSTGGWVSSDYLIFTKPQRKGIINYEGVNVRAGAGTNFALLEKLKINTPVTIFEEKDTFYRIGTGRWVKNSYVTLKLF